MKPLCIDLFCGLGGWADGFLAEGYDVIGFDIERHNYGQGGYAGQLVLQDARTLHGGQFQHAACIVASPPCQAYSYRAMPWKRAKALPPPSNELFDTCFRIQAEACKASGRYIPIVVENVKGAQPWVGRAAWHYGSYYLWGDVPALMPFTERRTKNRSNGSWFDISHGRVSDGQTGHPRKALGFEPPEFSGRKVSGINFSGFGKPGYKAHGFNVTAAQRYRESIRQEGSGPVWFDNGICRCSSTSDSRKAASAFIAKIPSPLAQHIARVFKPLQSHP